METRERRKSTYIRWAVAVGLPALGILIFLIFSGNRAFANFSVKFFSRPVRDALGTVFGIIPLSVMELMYIAAGVFVIWFLVRSVILTVRAQKKLQVAARRAAVLILTAVYVFTAYLWLLGIDYRSDSFEDKSGLETGPVSTRELYTVARFFIVNAAQLAPDVPRDSEGHFIRDIDGFFDASAHIYDNATEEFPFLEAAHRRPKKMYLFSRLSSAMGFTGVYFPFTGESNINIDAPACLIPATIAHELAHRRGIYAEQEANFAGIMACLSSGDTVYTYSGFLMGSIYLANALSRADPELWYELAREITGPMRIDWTDDSAYWASFESKVSEVSEKVYDGYLKANGQELGMKSYGACVDLLVAYYLEAASA